MLSEGKLCNGRLLKWEESVHSFVTWQISLPESGKTLIAIQAMAISTTVEEWHYGEEHTNRAGNPNFKVKKSALSPNSALFLAFQPFIKVALGGENVSLTFKKKSILEKT